MPSLTEKQASFLGRHLGYDPSPDSEQEPPTQSGWGTSPVSSEENDRLNALTPDALVQTNLVQTDLKQLFEEDYMSDLKDTTFRGEDDPKLKDLMREIEKGLSGPRRAEVMQALARIVGVPPTAEALDTDYGRFLIVQKQQKVTGLAKDDSPPDLDEEMHPEFRASRGQLLFGKVLGDAFGIHEVFAALLSPTGGLVGPGNWFARGVMKAGHLDPDNPVALHGCVHDAAGYLLTFHDDGPGYNYLESDIELLPTDHPLSGQLSGIAYWTAEAGDEYVTRRLDSAVATVEKGLQSVRDAVTSKIDSMLSVFRGKKADPGEDVSGGDLDTVGALEDALSKSKTCAVDPYDTEQDSTSLPEQAEAKLNATKRFLWS